MDASVWPRIEELFHEASRLEDAAARSAYLSEACDGDEALRGEVESLLAALENGGSFFEQPAFSLGMRILSDGMTGALSGSSIRHYRVIRLLGAGGMGEVYLAEDRKLERLVALKFLSRGFIDDQWAKEQLRTEARLVAQLENPHICTVYDIDDAEGRDFIVMQYAEGETLAAHMRRERLAPARVLDLALQIVGALSAAHARGVVHRDIKPLNIIVTPAGQVKVLDFGLAKFVRPVQGVERAGGAPGHLSQAGFLAGTVAYMSPEQAQGGELDCRSDIFSLGIVLYEMLAGRGPFLRETEEETIAAIKAEEPSFADLPEGLPDGFLRVVRKCLAKERAERFDSAEQLLQELLELQRLGRREAHTPRRVGLANRYVVVPTIAAAVFIVCAASVSYFLTRVQKVAVLPVANETGDPGTDYIGEGLTQSLIENLSSLSRLRVKPLTVVALYKNARLDPVEAGRELKVDAVLSSQLTRRGESLTLRSHMIDTASGSTMWERTFDVKATELLALQEELTRSVIGSLNLWVGGDEKRQLAKRPTGNEEALRQYMLGRYYWGKKRDRENLQAAVGYFERAIELDPLYAKAHAGLADCYVLMGSVAYGSLPSREAMHRARAAAKEALAIDPDLCEAHTSLGIVKLRYEWNWAEAEAEFRRAILLNPDYAPAHYWYSNLLVVLKRPDDALRESETTRELDPFSPLSTMNHGRVLYYARRYGEAAEWFRRMLDANPDDARALYMLGLVLLQQRDYAEAVETLRRLHAVDRLFAAAPLGYAYGKTGRREEALGVIRELEELGRQGHVPPQERAIVYVGMGDRDEAFRLLEEAYRERFPALTNLTTEPLFDDLRPDSRYADLARRINLPL